MHCVPAPADPEKTPALKFTPVGSAPISPRVGAGAPWLVFTWDAAGSAGVIVNLSVWAYVEHLAAFVFGETHRQVLRQRRDWFLLMREAHVACWWVPAGQYPTTGEAEDRVRHLRAHGPTPHAFTLRNSYPPPGAGQPDQNVTDRADWLCPA